VLNALAIGMTEVPAYFEGLAKAANATVDGRHSPGNYPFAGVDIDIFGYISIDAVDDLNVTEAYPNVSSYLPPDRAAGIRLFKVLEDNIAQREITVRLGTPAKRLITDASGAVCGLITETKKGVRNIKASQAVILTCGGFEANSNMQKQYWQEKPVLPVAFSGNTGDGIRMAQTVGADLWHMWHYHGTYGVKHPDPDYPYGVRVKRLPDWVPGRKVREDVKVPWIIIDRNGRRYMNEYQPYTQDTSARPMVQFDTVTQTYPRIPSLMVFDDDARGTYPLCAPTFNDPNLSFDYSRKSLQELEDKILHKADTFDELAAALDMETDILIETIDHWNASCAAGKDRVHGRPPSSMVKIEKPPFYYAEVWPLCQNTHGGPVHNIHQQVTNGYDEPIPRLYAAGELGGVFGHLYLAGGNLAECFVGGWTAGRHAANLESW
jgi:succinate dehydrogenase/fumarate reductase flavoprotein subunit